MSVSLKKQVILCDRPGCAATARVPVALHPTLISDLTGKGGEAPPPAAGWLFVSRSGIAGRHFCPACVGAYLTEHSRHPDAAALAADAETEQP